LICVQNSEDRGAKPGGRRLRHEEPRGSGVLGEGPKFLGSAVLAPSVGYRLKSLPLLNLVLFEPHRTRLETIYLASKQISWEL